MSALARWLVLGLGVVSFLVAAKAHGRQLRLERELAGYWEVTFGGQNPSWVEALWRREVIFWILAALLTLLTIGFRVFASRYEWPLPVPGPGGDRTLIGFLVLHVLLPLVGAFVATGLLSLVRFALAARVAGGGAGRPAGWLGTAAWGSAGWWALTLAILAALFVSAWRRPA